MTVGLMKWNRETTRQRQFQRTEMTQNSRPLQSRRANQTMLANLQLQGRSVLIF